MKRDIDNIIVVNCGMFGNEGHDYAWNSSIQNAARQKGIPVSFLFRRDIPGHLLAEFDNSHAVLTNTIYCSPFFYEVMDSESHNAFIEQARQVRNDFDALLTPYTAQTLFLCHTADPATMLGMLWWCSALPPESQPEIFFHLHYSFAPLGAWAARLFTMMREAMSSVKHVRFAACVDGIASFMTHHLQTEIILLPMPFHFESTVITPQNILYGYAGGGREEQGVGILAPLVTEYIKRGGKNSFMFQIGFTWKNENILYLQKELEALAEQFPDQIQLLPYIITGDEYKKLLRQFSCMLLPYSSEKYHPDRPSQICQESIALGIPSVVCKGSSLAYEVTKAANGSLVVDNLDVATLCDALFAFEANASEHTVQAGIAAERYREYNNMEMFMQTVLHTRRQPVALRAKAGDTDLPYASSSVSTLPLSSAERTSKKKQTRRPSKRSVSRAYRRLCNSPLFQAHYYLTQNEDVRKAGMDPLRHFLRHGWKEGRKPNPLFDPAYYLAAYYDVRMAGVNPLIHYMEYGWKEGRNPGPLFNAPAYLASNEDVLQAKMEPLTHFLRYGLLEGRRLS